MSGRRRNTGTAHCTGDGGEKGGAARLRGREGDRIPIETGKGGQGGRTVSKRGKVVTAIKMVGRGSSRTKKGTGRHRRSQAKNDGETETRSSYQRGEESGFGDSTCWVEGGDCCRVNDCEARKNKKARLLRDQTKQDCRVTNYIRKRWAQKTFVERE